MGDLDACGESIEDDTSSQSGKLRNEIRIGGKLSIRRMQCCCEASLKASEHFAKLGRTVTPNNQ
jgi:hypothetical protein